MHVKPHHPLQELLAQLLFGIETVPTVEQRRMVNRACKEAAHWHKAQVKQMKSWLREMEKYVYVCPECGWSLSVLSKYNLSSSFDCHSVDCEFAAMLMDMRG
jgi:acetyl-CoA carboxylase beta subunit